MTIDRVSYVIADCDAQFATDCRRVIERNTLAQIKDEGWTVVASPFEGKRIVCPACKEVSR